MRIATAAPTPTPEELAHWDTYGFHIVMSGDHARGEIGSQPNGLRWRYSPSSQRAAISCPNPFGERDVVYANLDGSPVLVIRRVGTVPAAFEMIEDGIAVGTIVLRSVLRNRYRIELAGSASWDFRMPLFSSRFYGVSSSGARVFARAGPWSNQWLVLADPSRTSARLLFALAFIHNRAWNHG